MRLNHSFAFHSMNLTLGHVHVLFTWLSSFWRLEYYRKTVQTKTKERFIEEQIEVVQRFRKFTKQYGQQETNTSTIYHMGFVIEA